MHRQLINRIAEEAQAGGMEPTDAFALSRRLSEEARSLEEDWPIGARILLACYALTGFVLLAGALYIMAI